MDKEEKKTIAVIGNEEFTLGFKLAGVQKTFGKENYEEKIEELLERDDIGIIAAEQKDVRELPQRLRKRVKESVDPVVVSLSEEASISGLEEKIQNVIGIDIS